MNDLLAGLPIPSDLDTDALIAASAAVRDYCDWHIAPLLTETVTVPVSRAGVALLPTLKVVTVTSVNGATAGFTVTSGGRLTLTGIAYRDVVTVELTHGYDTCPPAVAAAVFQLAARGLVPGPRVKSDTAGPYGVTYFDPVDPLDCVYAYRRVGVA